MDSYQLALLVGATCTMAIAWSLPRAVIWIVLMALSFIISSAYWNLHAVDPHFFLYPAMVAGLCDVAVVLTMHRLAELRWEMRLANVIHAMIFVNVLWTIPSWFSDIFGWLAVWLGVSERMLYAALLDIGNWTALAIIGGTAIVQMAGRYGNHSRWCLGGFLMSLRHHLLAHRPAHSHWQ